MEGGMIDFSDLVSAFRRLDLPPDTPVMAHASLSAFGPVDGGAQTVVDALLSIFPALMMPGFTYKTMLVPDEGPANNGLVYGTYTDSNRQAKFFRPNMPVDRLIGAIPEALRLNPGARRSLHPILSFVGVNVDRFLESQSIAEPLAPFRSLIDANAWVLLLGVDHTVNTAIHFAERLAGRRQFLRWALTPRGVVECPGFPGCSDGFNAIAPRLGHAIQQGWAGQAQLQAIPLIDLVGIARAWLEVDPLALLCDHSYCERCQALRADFARSTQMN
jgi:aminoglycoside 3-N-acetyltransferase